MSQASREMALTSLQAEALPDETEVSGGLPSPLAEIAAQTVRSSVGEPASEGRASSMTRGRGRARKGRRSRPKKLAMTAGEVLVGTLVGFNDAAEPLVCHPLEPLKKPTVARSTVALNPGQIDREVVIAFESGDPRKPIILGVLWSGEDSPARPRDRSVEPRPQVEATADGEQLVFSAQREIVLRCGEASITLTRAGKVLIRGTYLLSRSSGVNRVKGGSVQIN